MLDCSFCMRIQTTTRDGRDLQWKKEFRDWGHLERWLKHYSNPRVIENAFLEALNQPAEELL